MMKEAQSVVNTAYKDAKAVVRKETERKIKEAENRGRQEGKMEMQKRIADLQARAIKAENALADVVDSRERYKNEIAHLQEELATERNKRQEVAERYVKLITTVRENFSKVRKTDKVRVDCQKYFVGTELYDIVKWR